jgi:hypothetical protein
MLTLYKSRIREQIRCTRMCRIAGSTSSMLRQVLFNAFVRPLFTWLCCLFPLMTNRQQDELGHFYFSCRKRSEGNFLWNNILFAHLKEEQTFENMCHKYWGKFVKSIRGTKDELILQEQSCWDFYRNQWIDKQIRVRSLYRSKRITKYTPTVVKGVRWYEMSDLDSTPYIPVEDMEVLASFPESFL